VTIKRASGWLIAIVIATVALRVPAATPPVSFARDVVPLFAKECASCHMKEGPSAGLILEPRFAYAMTVGVRANDSGLLRVAPGRPDQSYLLLKMQDRHRAVGGAGGKMPPGWQRSTPQEIDLVRAWIAAGAKHD
jgi:mono/diheme cytochrome c family protein